MGMGTTNRRWLLNARRSGGALPDARADLLDQAEVLLTYRQQLVAELDELDRQLQALAPSLKATGSGR